MGFLSIFKRKDKRNNHSFDETDRHLSLEMRRLNAEKKRVLQEIEIANAQYELERTRMRLEEMYEDDEEETTQTDLSSPDALLTTLLSQILLKGQQNNQNSSVNTSPLQNPSVVELSQEQIKNIVDSIPKSTLKQIKKMNEEQRISLAKNYMPNLNDQQIKQISEYIGK